MKRVKLLVSVLILPLMANDNVSVIDTIEMVEDSKPKIKVEEAIYIAPKKIKKLDVENDLIPAMIQVESMGNDSAIGDRHLVGNEAVGALQIRPIMVREVNRILKLQKSEKRFKRKDRFSREKSIEMFLIWKNYHHPDGGFETITRNWNGGPRGYKNPKTEHYWVKIQKELNNM